MSYPLMISLIIEHMIGLTDAVFLGRVGDVALIGDVDLLHKDKLQRKLGPEKRFYMASGMPMTEAAIDTGFLRDVYVSLGEPIERDKLNGAWVVRVYLKPFVDWIWGGCLLMSIGGLLAICDRRYRVWKK